MRFAGARQPGRSHGGECSRAHILSSAPSYPVHTTGLGLAAPPPWNAPAQVGAEKKNQKYKKHKNLCCLQHLHKASPTPPQKGCWRPAVHARGWGAGRRRTTPQKEPSRAVCPWRRAERRGHRRARACLRPPPPRGAFSFPRVRWRQRCECGVSSAWSRAGGRARMRLGVALSLSVSPLSVSPCLPLVSKASNLHAPPLATLVHASTRHTPHRALHLPPR